MKIIEKILNKYYAINLVKTIKYDICCKIYVIERVKYRKCGNNYVVEYEINNHWYGVYKFNKSEGLSNLIYYINKGSKDMWEYIGKLEKEKI